MIRLSNWGGIARAGARFRQGAFALLYPPRAVCIGCGDKSGCAADYLCAACLEALAREKPRVRMRPDKSKLWGRAHAHHYTGPASNLVKRFKYDGIRALADLMAEDMLRALPLSPEDFDCVAGVPMHAFRRYVRGMNHADLLAEAIAARLGLSCERVLTRARATAQQARLSHEKRQSNLTGAFRAEPVAAGKSILLIDDVYTTGSTAEECARTLLAGGAKQVFLLTYATAK